jgi:predicted alpha-1,2-mannosidase
VRYFSLDLMPNIYIYMRNYYFGTVFCLFILLSTHVNAQKKGFTNFVDPFIGTAAHGHTHPAATLPFGMVQLGPDTRPSMMDWDGCSGYHYTDSLLYGFSHTHLSGTGVPDLNDILVMPFMGDVLPFELKNYAAEMDKKTEKAVPGYYAVQLKKSKITCEMTATERVGVHRYTFPVNKEMVRLLVDLRYRDNVLDAGLNYVNDREISGFRFSKAWAENQKIYFVMRFSHAFSSSNLLDTAQSPNISAPAVNSKSVVGLLHFYNDEAPLVVTVGISAVSIEGARRNLEAECPDYNFDKVRQNASSAWEKLLSSIAVEGGTTEQNRTFYTALYHSMLAPNLWSDVDKQYRGMDDQVHSASHDVYTTFSLWDTYRAANPLHALLVPDRMRNFIKTFLLQYRQGGLLPVWELAANETNCMIGNHAIPVILDAYTKGLVDPNDAKELLQAMLKSARLDRLGLEQYRRKGYIPGDEEPESVSKTLEYAYDDWCIAQFAEALGEKDIAAEFLLRSKQYANLYDPKTGFFRGKANGTWRTPFDPKEVNFNYTEANAWQYRFSVQQDIPGLIHLMGGRDTFARRLDGIFNEVSATTGRNQADITGLIGQYAHGNEPCHHVAYLFNDVQQPWKTQYRVKQIMRDLYTDKPDGLCGNDDCGQTSAWYVWSAMGFYPVTPGSAQYAIGAPAFEKVTLNLPNTKRFEVHSVPSFLYIQSAVLNGQKYEATYLPHSAIMAGGKMDFVTGSHQSNWGTVAPPTTAQAALKSIPFIAAGERVFRDKQQIALGCADVKAKIFYKINNGKSHRYQKPFTINRSCNLQFWVEQNGQSSVEETARFFKKMNNLKVISYKNPYNAQYTGGGMDGLVDLLAGGADFRSGGWQGFEGADMEVVLDFGKKQEIKRVAANFIQDENSWIFFPVKVEMETSDDGVNFTPVGTIVNQIPTTVKGTIQQSFATNLSSTQARYLRVRGVSMGKCPPEHKGAGYSSWLFADEIWVD